MFESSQAGGAAAAQRGGVFDGLHQPRHGQKQTVAPTEPHPSRVAQCRNADFEYGGQSAQRFPDNAASAVADARFAAFGTGWQSTGKKSMRGLGHSAFDAFVSGKGVNVNALMSPVEDPGTGLEAAWGVRAKLIKA